MHKRSRLGDRGGGGSDISKYFVSEIILRKE